MRRSISVLAVTLLVAACGADEPDQAPAAIAAEADADAEDGSVADPDGEEDPDTDGDADADDDVEVADDEPLLPPGAVTGAIGVTYRGSGSFDETFTLIQGLDVSVFRSDDATMYVTDDSITVCSEGEPCVRAGRELFESMGMLGGQIVEDVTSFAAEIPWTSATPEQIAGRDARCLVTSDVADLDEYCYDLVSGIALRWKVLDEGVPTLVEAIDVFEPTDADVTPSGPIEELGG